MGKSGRNRIKTAQRHDPIAKQPKPPSDPELAALRDQKILPVLKNLQATDSQTRSLAAKAIANIITDEKCRRLLLRDQLVRILMTETLTDSSIDSRASGWEILRLLVEHGDPGFCIHLYRQDILTAIEHACVKVRSQSSRASLRNVLMTDRSRKRSSLSILHLASSQGPSRTSYGT